MANDPPTSLRMGFGYHQARAAGLDGIRQSRSPQQVNRYVAKNKETRETIRFLREAANDPHWKPFITHRVAEGRNARQISVELHAMRMYTFMRSRGGAVESCLKRFWSYFN